MGLGGSGGVKKRIKKSATKKGAPVKATGGAGFTTFADKVGAYFLLDLVRGGIPLGPDAGPIAALHFETRESGWLIDDQLLVMKNAQREARCAVSVKSDSRLTATGLDQEFVSDAWRQWDGVEGASFDRERDFLALATLAVTPPVIKDWNEIALTNSLLQYVLTCVVEPPEDVLPAARARAKARYAKILRHAAQEVATRNKATLEEVLSHGKQL